MILRPHQINAHESIISAYDNGDTRQIVNMSTGTGKTVVFSTLIDALNSRLPGKTLLLAHTEELINQAIKTLEITNLDKKIDKEMAEHKADPATADIVVASVASLGRKGSKRLEKYNWAEFDKIIVDEAHHSTAGSYLNILRASGALRPGSNKLLLGATATTQRADGEALGSIYTKISYVYSLRQAIKDGQLVDVRGFRINTETDIQAVGSTYGDFKLQELADKINNPARNLKIVEAWDSHADERQTVVFCATVQHAQDLATAFRNNGVTAHAIWAYDPERELKLANHKDGLFQVLVNVGILTEGYDDPRIGCVVIARPTKSGTLFTQMCGRATRLAEGKTDAIILDVVDMSAGHSLCTVPTLMGLAPNLDLQGRSLLASVEELEAAQEKNPNVDFAKLKNIGDLKSYVEQINLFAVNFPAEVESNSDFKWTKAATGGFRMSIPKSQIDTTPSKPGWVTIKQNLLDTWEIDGVIRDTKIHGVRPTMEEAFAAADDAIRKRAGDVVCLVDRKSSWNTQPATAKQFLLLTKLYKGKKWPDDLTRGQAAHFIDVRLAKKAGK